MASYSLQSSSSPRRRFADKRSALKGLIRKSISKSTTKSKIPLPPKTQEIPKPILKETPKKSSTDIEPSSIKSDKEHSSNPPGKPQSKFRRATMPSSRNNRKVQFGYIPVVEQPPAPQYVMIDQVRANGLSVCPSSSKGGPPKTIVFAGNSRHYLAQISRPRLPKRKEVPRAWTRTDMPAEPPTFQLSRGAEGRFSSQTKPIPIADSAVCLSDNVPYSASLSTTMSSYSEDGFSDDSDAVTMRAPSGSDACVQHYALPQSMDTISQKLANVRVTTVDAARV